MKNGKWIKKWKVKSENSDREYTVSLSDLGVWGCSCPAWKFRRQECAHIKHIKRTNPEPSETPIEAKPPPVILARVLEPKLDEEAGVILCPLIAIPDGALMEATICWFLMEHGYTLKRVREVRQHIPPSWTKTAIYNHIERHGPAKHPPSFYTPRHGAT